MTCRTAGGQKPIAGSFAIPLHVLAPSLTRHRHDQPHQQQETFMARSKWIIVGAVATAAAALLAVPAQARTSVSVQIGTGAPYGYGSGYGGYGAPQPAYVYGQPGYVVSHPGYGHAHPGYVQAQPVYYGRPQRQRLHDRDRDGVPDRFDRRPRNPYRY
jgi:hypothetical protein